MAESKDSSGVHRSLVEKLSDVNAREDVMKSMGNGIINCLSLDDNENKEQIVNDLLENGRQSLIKYKEDIISKTYKEVMTNNDNELFNLLKKILGTKMENTIWRISSMVYFIS